MINKILEDYKLRLKLTKIIMPCACAMFLIAGIVLCIIHSEVFWIGLIVALIGVGLLFLFFFVKKCLEKVINDLENKAKMINDLENEKNDKDQM